MFFNLEITVTDVAAKNWVLAVERHELAVERHELAAEKHELAVERHELAAEKHVLAAESHDQETKPGAEQLERSCSMGTLGKTPSCNGNQPSLCDEPQCYRTFIYHRGLLIQL